MRCTLYLQYSNKHGNKKDVKSVYGDRVLVISVKTGKKMAKIVENRTRKWCKMGGN